jgi:hypothetical protein
VKAIASVQKISDKGAVNQFSIRNMTCAFVVLRLFRLQVTMSPAFEKRHLDGTDVAGTGRFLQAAVHTAGKIVAFAIHHWNWSAPMI